MIYPREIGRGAKGGKLARNLGLSTERVRQARTTLTYAPDLAANVLSGSASLDAAYKTARDRKDAASSLRRPVWPEWASDHPLGEINRAASVFIKTLQQIERRADR